MFWNEFLNYMKKGNTNATKFFGAEQNFDDVGAVITAMANAQGGFIFLGFDLRNYHLLGSKLDSQDIEKLIKIHCNPYPKIKLDTLIKNDKEVMIIEVCDSHSKPYYFNNKCYVMDNNHVKLSFLDKAATEKTTRGEHPQTNVESHSQVVKEPQAQATAETSADESINETVSTHYGFDNTAVTKDDIQAMTDDLVELSDDVDTAASDESTSEEASEGGSFIISRAAQQLNERQEQTIEFLRNHDSIKNKKYRELHQVSHKTAHLELVDLVEKGKIECRGSGRSTCYILKKENQLSMFNR